MASIPGIDVAPDGTIGGLDSYGIGVPQAPPDTLAAVNAGSVIDASAATTNSLMTNVQNMIGGINGQALGSGIADLFQATGDRLEAKNYEEAQHLALIEKSVQTQATAIQQVQASRQVAMGIGGQKVAAAASGTTSGGSNLMLLRSSAQQAALAHQVIGQQGLLSETSEQAQADAYGNMASAAKNAATGDTVGGIFNIITSVGGDIAKAFGF